MKRKPPSAEQRRRRHLRNRYGIELEQVDAMIVAQGGGCAICAKQFADLKPKQRHVDHDHGTGVVRGVLCDTCNRGLGYLKDSAAILVKALEYLGRRR